MKVVKGGAHGTSPIEGEGLTKRNQKWVLKFGGKPSLPLRLERGPKLGKDRYTSGLRR